MHEKAYNKYEKFIRAILSLFVLFFHFYPVPLTHAAENPLFENQVNALLPAVSLEDVQQRDAEVPEPTVSPIPTLEKMDNPLQNTVEGVTTLPAYDDLYSTAQNLALEFRGADEYPNWGGLNEKWLTSKTGAWYYMLPTGEIRRWLGGDLASDPVEAHVSPEVHRNTKLLYEAQPSSMAQDDDLLLSVVRQENVQQQDAEVSDPTVSAIPILEDIDNLDQIPAEDVATATASDDLYSTAQNLALEFRGADEYPNWGGLNEKWLTSKTGTWYYILPTGEIRRWLGGDLANDPLETHVSPDAHGNMKLLYEAQVAAVDNQDEIEISALDTSDTFPLPSADSASDTQWANHDIVLEDGRILYVAADFNSDIAGIVTDPVTGTSEFYVEIRRENASGGIATEGESLIGTANILDDSTGASRTYGIFGKRVVLDSSDADSLEQEWIRETLSPSPENQVTMLNFLAAQVTTASASSQGVSFDILSASRLGGEKQQSVIPIQLLESVMGATRQVAQYAFDFGIPVPIDALRIINYLNTKPEQRAPYHQVKKLDTNGDGVIAPNDVLIMINQMNRYPRNSTTRRSGNFTLSLADSTKHYFRYEVTVPPSYTAKNFWEYSFKLEHLDPNNQVNVFDTLTARYAYDGAVLPQINGTATLLEVEFNGKIHSGTALTGLLREMLMSPEEKLRNLLQRNISFFVNAKQEILNWFAGQAGTVIPSVDDSRGKLTLVSNALSLQLPVTIKSQSSTLEISVNTTNGDIQSIFLWSDLTAGNEDGFGIVKDTGDLYSDVANDKYVLTGFVNSVREVGLNWESLTASQRQTLTNNLFDELYGNQKLYLFEYGQEATLGNLISFVGKNVPMSLVNLAADVGSWVFSHLGTSIQNAVQTAAQNFPFRMVITNDFSEVEEARDDGSEWSSSVTGVTYNKMAGSLATFAMTLWEGGSLSNSLLSVTHALFSMMHTVTHEMIHQVDAAMDMASSLVQSLRQQLYDRVTSAVRELRHGGYGGVATASGQPWEGLAEFATFMLDMGQPAGDNNSNAIHHSRAEMIIHDPTTHDLLGTSFLSGSNVPTLNPDVESLASMESLLEAAVAATGAGRVDFQFVKGSERSHFLGQTWGIFQGVVDGKTIEFFAGSTSITRDDITGYHLLISNPTAGGVDIFRGFVSNGTAETVAWEHSLSAGIQDYDLLAYPNDWARLQLLGNLLVTQVLIS